MNQRRRLITKLTIGLGLASILAGPLTLAAGAGPLAPPPLAQPFGFTPSIEALATEKAPDDLLEDELVLPDAFVEGNILVIDGRPYPIGDGFYDAEGIPLGPAKTDMTGLYGYARIENVPDHILIWYLDGTGRRQYLVTREDDALMQGPLGFDRMIENLQNAQNRLVAGAGTGIGGLLTAAILQLAVCPGTAGATCATAAATLLIGGGIALVGALGLIAFDLIPALNNVSKAFSTFDSNRP